MRRAFLVVAGLAAAGLVAAGCGGDDTADTSTATTTGTETTTTSSPPPTTSVVDDGPFLPDLPEPQLDDANRFARGSSVGDGDLPSGAPPIAPAVSAAAKKAGCTVKGFPSEGRQHVAPDAAPAYGTQPPTSGNHFAVWAPFGAYDAPVPDMAMVHNLEHGAIVVSIGPEVPAAARAEIGKFWADSPPFMMVVPGRSKAFPAKGVVVTSWQRWMVCKPFEVGQLDAIRAYRDQYRGTGPEPVAALDAGGGEAFPGVPEPLVADPGAS